MKDKKKSFNVKIDLPDSFVRKISGAMENVRGAMDGNEDSMMHTEIDLHEIVSSIKEAKIKASIITDEETRSLARSVPSVIIGYVQGVSSVGFKKSTTYIKSSVGKDGKMKVNLWMYEG